MAKLHVFDSCVVAVALCVVVVARRQSVEDANETLSNMLEFSQDSIEQLIEAQTITVDFNLTLSTSMGFSQDCWLDVTCNDRFVGDVIENVQTPVACTGTTYGNFTVLAKFLGITSLSFHVYSSESDAIHYSHEGYRLSVIRKPRFIDKAFGIIVTIVIILNTVGFGATIEIPVVKKILKRPIAPAIGGVCQLVIMPLMAFGLASAVLKGNSLKLGLLTMGSSPGGGASNIWTFLLDGDITLSITMTLINTILTLGTMPMWLTLLGKYFTEGTNLRIPFANIILGLSYMIGPVGIGLVIKIYRPTWAAFMMRILKPCCAILVVILIVTGVYSSWYIFSLVTPLIVAVASSLPWLGFTMGGLVAIITRRPWPIVKTIAIETGFQNAGIALVLLRSTFPQPEADLAAVVPIICTILTPLPLIVIFIVRLVVMRIRGESTSADLTADKAKSKSNLAVKPESYVPHVDNDKMAEKEKETQRSEHGTENGNASTAVEMEVKKRKSPSAKDIKEKVGQANPALADDDWTEEEEGRSQNATSIQKR